MSYYGSEYEAKLSDLLGRVLVKVENRDNEEIVFTSADGAEYRLLHQRDCCESVRVEDINGNLDDLVGSPITLADASSSGDWPADLQRPEYLDSFTWTFYRFATVKGYVDIRWFGTSNGYYSESVDFVRTSPPDHA